jgi:uncharacterized membrane protein YphA (DoxX/SURF4 family)
MVKVPSDPAQVIVSHASFRVQLGVPERHAQSPRIARHLSATQDTAPIPVVGAGGSTGVRRRPVVWSGRSAPDDSGAHRLLQAVRSGGLRYADEPVADVGATQVIPRVDVDGGPAGSGYDGYGGYDDGPGSGTVETPVVGAQRGHDDHTPHDTGGTRLLPHMRASGSVYDEPGYDEPGYDAPGHADEEFDDPGAAERSTRRQADDPARHAYYPSRRMNLGVVLLPLRVFLGFISVYAGMGKLCDPHYFDGGQRGSMVKWLNTLHPWEVAEPLRQFALEHPVGSGLVIAFFQVIIGVLTVLGCWQRVAAVVGALLSAALLVTVSWKSVPAYDTPDIIYLAAWSPLIIAGAPVYSVDGRLGAGAWRRLGPRAPLWDLRRYVLRRGALVTTVVVGLTLLIGSVLGGAVRDADRVVVPGPGEAPRNELPGSPLPDESRTGEGSPSAPYSPTQGSTSGPAGPSAGSSPTQGATAGATSGTTAGTQPTQTQGTTGQAPQQPSSGGRAPSTSSGPSSGGPTSGDGAGDSSSQPGFVGGLLG